MPGTGGGSGGTGADTAFASDSVIVFLSVGTAMSVLGRFEDSLVLFCRAYRHHLCNIEMNK